MKKKAYGFLRMRQFPNTHLQVSWTHIKILKQILKSPPAYGMFDLTVAELSSKFQNISIKLGSARTSDLEKSRYIYMRYDICSRYQVKFRGYGGSEPT